MSAPETPMGRPALDSGNEDGIRWVTLQAPVFGGVNGYAQIPEGHPWHGKGYDEIDPDVHGGLTYAKGDWIGFDTMHAGDYWSGMPDAFEHEGHHWTAEEVADEARQLARQVAAASAEVSR